jgi:hypothetical protein
MMILIGILLGALCLVAWLIDVFFPYTAKQWDRMERDRIHHEWLVKTRQIPPPLPRKRGHA